MFPIPVVRLNLYVSCVFVILGRGKGGGGAKVLSSTSPGKSHVGGLRWAIRMPLDLVWVDSLSPLFFWDAQSQAASISPYNVLCSKFGTNLFNGE